MKPDIQKLMQQGEDIREALAAIADATKTLPLTPTDAELLIPFIHDTAEIATAFTARLQNLFLGIATPATPVTDTIELEELLAGRLRCQFIGPTGKQCEKIAIGYVPDGEHIGCKKHGGEKIPPAAASPPEKPAVPGNPEAAPNS